jgi:hypothetical protein
LLDKQKRLKLYFVIASAERHLMFCPRCGLENPPGANYCSRCGAVLSPAGALAPGVGSAFGHGWRTLRKNFAELFLAVIVYLALNIPVAIILGLIAYFSMGGFFIFDTGHLFDTFSWEFQLTNAVLGIVYYIPLAFGLFFVYLAAVRSEKIRLGAIFASFRNYPDVVLAGVFLVVASDGISFLLSLLTGHLPVLGALLSLAWTVFYLVLICKLVFVPLLLLDRRMKFIDAVRTSWMMTRGHEWQVFAMGLLVVLMFAAIGIIAFLISLIFILLPFALFVGLIVGVIGAIFLSMWFIAAYASLYHAVSASGASAKMS